MRRLLAISFLALISSASLSWAQQAQPDPEFRPTTLRLPDLDAGDRIVVIGMVPIPDVGEGAPLFTAQDLAQMENDARQTTAKTRSDVRRCGGASTGIVFKPGQTPAYTNLLAQEFEAGNRVAAAAGKARQVTERAEAARRDAAQGLVDMKVVEAAELERQAAVMVLQKARADLVEAQAMIGDLQDMALGQTGRIGITWGDLDMRALNRKREGVGLGIALPEDFETLDIKNVVASQHKDKKGKDMVVVRGDIVNTGRKSTQLPSLSVSLVDYRGWVLTNSTVEAPGMKKSIGAGKTQAFAVEMRPAPELLKMAVVTFAAKHAAEPRMRTAVLCSGALGGR